MSNDDPFADLDEMAGDEQPDTDDDPAMDDQGSGSGGEYPAPDPAPAPDPDPDPEPEPEVDPREQPAFPFDAALQRPLYAREESWEAFADVCDFDAKRILRDAGIRNIEGREFHDAALRLAAENPDALAEEVQRLRGLDSETE